MERELDMDGPRKVQDSESGEQVEQETAASQRGQLSSYH
jgi:hypothetical protein